MKKKLLILINSDLYVRNYFYTKSFSKIVKKYDCFFVGSGNEILDKKNFKNFIKKYNFLGFIKYPVSDLMKFNKFLYNNFLLNNKNSKTVNYIINQRNRFIIKYGKESFSDTIKQIFSRVISFLKKNIHYKYIKFKNRIEFNLVTNQKLRKILKNLKPELVIFPMQDTHILSCDVINMPYKTLGLIDNWDNLSSRGSHVFKTNYLTVWGEQTKKHAISYQGYKSKNTFVIGTPRFDKYFELRNKKIKNNFKFKYILFLESFGDHRNQHFLENLSLFLKNNKKLSNHKVIFRPHPWQKKNLEKINLKQLNNVIIDPQLSLNYLKDLNSTKYQPNIDYYPSLIKNADLIITGPTSMVIEAAIFYKKTLLLGFKDKKNFSYDDELKNFIHLDKLNKLHNLVVCKNLKNMNMDLNKLIKIKINKKKLDLQRNYFLSDTSKRYSDKLCTIVDKILSE